MSEILLSKTGIINHYGKARFKWVSGLTKEERNHVRNGGVVLVGIPLPMQARSKARYKKVTFYHGRYGHRNWKEENDA